MHPFAKDVMMRGLDEWSKANPQDLQRLCKFFKDVCELRMKQESGKAKIVTKYQKNPITNLPRKYIRPINDKVKPELFIVEGDSALGKAQEDRIADFQGIMPIRGKIINAFKASKKDFFNNEEVQGITRIIFGQDYKKGLTIDDCKVDKIIFMTDGDVDGAHIAALLLRMFVLYFPFLISNGKVYKAIPPLYSIKEGKKTKYFTENIDLIKYIQKRFLTHNDIKNIKKKAITNRELTKFFLTNADYIYFLEKTANTFAVDPYLLEMVLYHYVVNKHKIKYDKLKKEVTSAYRFMNVHKQNGTIIVKGTIDKSNLIIISDKFIRSCTDILNLIEANKDLYYILNKNKATVYTIMKAYEDAMPNAKIFQRYKGLGEMGDGQLGESTMHPDSRTLIQYTMEDAKEAIQFIRDYESDGKKILSEVGLVTRDDLVD
jgi:DNA gyrase subunit B